MGAGGRIPREVSAGAAAWTVSQQEAARTAGAAPWGRQQRWPDWPAIAPMNGQEIPHPANNPAGEQATRTSTRRAVIRMRESFIGALYRMILKQFAPFVGWRALLPGWVASHPFG